VFHLLNVLLNKKGGMYMDIAALSMASSQANIMTQVNTAVLSMNLDTIETASDSMIKLMEQSVAPNLGQTIDVSI
jgi:hypothetical protein